MIPTTRTTKGVSMTEQEKLTEVLNRHLDLQAKMMTLVQGQSIQNKNVSELITRLDKVVELVDNYPLRTLEKVEEVREKLAGEDGLRVEIRRQHAEMKGLVRNWQLFAAALITALSMLANILLR